MEKKMMMNSTREKLSIPQEIIFEIFSWLPVKSLMRFKCVSRFSSSFVSKSDFVDIHSCRCISGTKSLLHEGGVYYAAEQKKDEKGFVSFLQIERFNEFYHHAPEYSRLNCVNGLFCVWEPYSVQPVAIFNPGTREVRFLPVLHGDIFYRYNYSLGFEPKEKKYKVLLTTGHIREGYINNWIFTLGIDKSWREIQNVSPCIMYSKSNVCLSGVIYHFARSNYEYVIAAFDVKSEKFEIIALWINAIELDHYELIEVKKKLAVIDYKRWGYEYIDLWILEQTPRKEWEKHIIKVLSIWNDIKPKFVSSCMARDGEIVFALNLMSGALYCLCYDVTRKSWRKLKIKGLPKESNIKGIYSYVERLVLLR